MSIFYCETYKNPPAILKNCSATFGIFDGIHKGHLYEIEKCCEYANANSLNSVAITFDIDPDEIFNENFVKLMTNEERIKQLNSTKIDDVVVIKFDKKLQNSFPEVFLDYFFGLYTPRFLNIGTNFRFGYKQKGDVILLKKWGQNNGMEVKVNDLLKSNGKVISSSLLREKLKQDKC